MMKQICRRLFLLGIILFSMSYLTRAQLAAVPVEVETTVLYGNYGEPGVDLTGYVMYEVYVKFTGPGNYLGTIFAAEGIPDCVQDPDSSAFFDFPCGLFQHEQETPFGFQNTCFYNFNLFPTSEFDSFLTMGKNCASDVSCDIDINHIGFCDEWIDAFQGPTNGDFFDGGSFFWDEYAMYVASCLNAGSAAYAGPDNRIKIAQFTSCGPISGCFNLSYRTQAQVDNNDQTPITALNICFEKEHPCLANPMDNTPLVGSAGCFGEAIQLTLSDGGNGAVDYQLHNTLTNVITNYDDEETGLIINPIDPGSYFLTMIDSTGCRDTTEVFQVTEPEQLTLVAELTQTVLCAGESTGEITIDCGGGTGILSLTMNGIQYNCGDVVTGLTCGTYNILLADENDCQLDTSVTIACPAALAYNPVVTSIPCFGYDNGSIVGNVSGGTGALTAVWTYNGELFETFNGNSPLNVSITELDGGTYEITIVDANGCELTDTFEITEPDEYSATPTVTDASCFGFCDGTVVFDIVGGTGPFNITCNILGGAAADPDALCAGDYQCVIEDDNGCLLTDTITVNEPTEITYESFIQSELCFNDCNGLIQLTNVQGSFGQFTYELTPNAGNCTGACAGNSVEYTDLCAGVYDILIADVQGCEMLVEDLELVAPGELQLILTPTNVTCFGLNNGEVDVTNIGGTEPFTLTPGNLPVPTTITDLAPGTYTYTITDDNGCDDTEDVIITEPALLEASVISTQGPSCGGDCDGNVVYDVIGGTTPYEFSLNPTGISGAVNGTVTSLCADLYEMIILDAFNCTDTIEFEIIEPDPLVIDVDLNAPTCTGMFDGQAIVTISGGTGELTLFIDPETVDYTEVDSVTFDLTGLGEMEIEFELHDETGCIIQQELAIIPDIITDMVLTPYSSPETCWNMIDGTATIAVQNGNLPISYLWNDDYNQTTATAVGLASNTTYTVVVTDAIGCTLTEEVYVEPTIGCFFISTGITPNGDGVNDTWVLGGLEFFPDAKIQVVNRWGQVVFESKGYTSQWDGTFKNEPLPIADYYFVIEYDESKDPIQGTVTIKY